ncbi:hypothetical protein QQP08_014716, partial [Theobroma cacao]
ITSKCVSQIRFKKETAKAKEEEASGVACLAVIHLLHSTRFNPANGFALCSAVDLKLSLLGILKPQN